MNEQSECGMLVVPVRMRLKNLLRLRAGFLPECVVDRVDVEKKGKNNVFLR